MGATILSLSLVAVIAAPALVGAAVTDPSTTNYGLTEFTGVKIGQGNNIKGTIASIINIILGFLGVIAVIIIMAGGFKWMTAAGNEDQVGEARKMITQAVAGLVVIFLSYVIANFVITQLESVTNA